MLLRMVISLMLFLLSFQPALHAETTWTQIDAGFGQAYLSMWGVTYGNGTFVAVGDVILTSPDGLIWTRRSLPSDNQLMTVTWNGSKFVAVGVRLKSEGSGFEPNELIGVVATSTDGINWTQKSIPGTTDHLNDIVYGDSIFIAVGDGNTVIRSTDGENWTVQSLPNQQYKYLYSVAYGQSQFVVVAYKGGIFSSPDGLTWTERPNPANDDSAGEHQIVEIAISDSKFVGAGLFSEYVSLRSSTRDLILSSTDMGFHGFANLHHRSIWACMDLFMGGQKGPKNS